MAAARTIRIDDEVFQVLQSRAEPFVDTPNSVLRKVLGLPPAHSALDDSDRRGELWSLIEAGLLEPGDILVWPRPRKGDSFEAIVGDDGSLVCQGTKYWSPSRAAHELSKSPANGWTSWRHGDSTLAELRDKFKKSHA